jgi:hypothetical protein
MVRDSSFNADPPVAVPLLERTERILADWPRLRYLRRPRIEREPSSEAGTALGSAHHFEVWPHSAALECASPDVCAYARGRAR